MCRDPARCRRSCRAVGVRWPHPFPRKRVDRSLPPQRPFSASAEVLCCASCADLVLRSDLLWSSAAKAPFDETSWTILNGDLSAYVKSKAIAERAAWDFIASEGRGLELSVVNPAGIFGPILAPDYSSSVELIKRLLSGMPGCPRIYFGVVDVRDVADLHVRAMTHPAAKGERFIAVSGDSISMVDIARMLRARLGVSAKRVPRFQLPDWVVRLAAKRDP